MATKIDYKRQTLLFDPVEHPHAGVSVIGLGNIGSHTAINLARLGIPSLALYDFDKVEVHNLTSQAYDTRDLGKLKANVLAERIKFLNPDVLMLPATDKFTGKTLDTFNPIVVIAVDSMKERKSIYNNLLKCEDKPSLIIDGRVGGNQLEVYTYINLKDWGKTFTDNPATDPCGGRFICYVSSIISGIITNQVRKFLKGEPVERSIMMNVNSMEVVKGFDW